MGPKELATPSHFISSPWPMPRKKKCPRMSIEIPDCQDILLRTTLSSANRDHEKGKYHATKGRLLKRPKGKPKHSGPVIWARWRGGFCSLGRKGNRFLLCAPGESDQMGIHTLGQGAHFPRIVSPSTSVLLAPTRSSPTFALTVVSSKPSP